MAVPSSYNDITQDQSIRDHIGWVWYDRTFFQQPRGATDQRLYLRFEGVHYYGIVVSVSKVHMCTLILTHTQIHKHTHAYTHTNTHTHTNSHIHTHTHTHTHIHTHTHNTHTHKCTSLNCKSYKII